MSEAVIAIGNMTDELSLIGVIASGQTTQAVLDAGPAIADAPINPPIVSLIGEF